MYLIVSNHGFDATLLGILYLVIPAGHSNSKKYYFSRRYFLVLLYMKKPRQQQTKEENSLQIHGVSEHNLKNLSANIPHDALTVLTGLSGSGKSSLAFHTVYAEGQRRYIETFNPYTRQFFDKVKKPESDYINNIRPAIAIQQKTRIVNARSTVGSMTNLNQYLRIIWANVARAHCYDCGIKALEWSPKRILKHIKTLRELKPESTFLLISPIKTENKKQLFNEVERLLVLGYTRFYDPKDSKIKFLEEEQHPTLSQDGKLFVVLERIKAGKVVKEKFLRENIEHAFSLSGGKVALLESDKSQSKKSLHIPQSRDHTLSGYREYQRFFSCEGSGFKLEKPKPALFSCLLYTSPSPRD